MAGFINVSMGSAWADQPDRPLFKPPPVSMTEYLGSSGRGTGSGRGQNDKTLQDEFRHRFDIEAIDASTFDSEGKVTTQKDGSKVVVKRVLRRREQAAADIDRDITIRCSLSDPAILPLIESLELEEVIWTVVEYRALRTVKDLIRENGAMPDATLKRTLNQLFSGIGSIFMAGFAHLRICDETICFDNEQQLIITDLQYACEYSKEKTGDMYAATREKYGSDIWVAPEVFAHVEYNARKAVMWSCGVLTYFMAAGNLEKLSSLRHPVFDKAEPHPDQPSTPPSAFRRFSTAETTQSHRRRSSASVQSKFLLHLNVLDIPTYARWVIPKMLAEDPHRRAELIEVATRIPKEYADKEARPLVELTWLDYKTHVGPLAGLEDPFATPNESSASSIHSLASRISNPFGSLLGHGDGRRGSVPVSHDFSRW